MVARGRADDAAVALLLRESGELHERAADLVRARSLEQLGLEPDVEAGLVAERARAQERGVMDVRRDQGQRGSRVGCRRHGHYGGAYWGRGPRSRPRRARVRPRWQWTTS